MNILIEKNLMVPMRDGVLLATDIKIGRGSTLIHADQRKSAQIVKIRVQKFSWLFVNPGHVACSLYPAANH